MFTVLIKTVMLSKSRLSKTVSLICLLQYVLSCVGQSEVFLNVTRQNDGDFYTRIIPNTDNSSCDSRFTMTVQSFSKENCTVRCKCNTKHKTYNMRQGRCSADKDILNAENCNGSFLPSFGEPLYDLSKPGKAQLRVSSLNNQSLYCNISKIAYFNGTNEIDFMDSGFDISGVLNGSALLTWNPRNSPILSKLEQFGYLVKVRVLCNMTSQQQRSCFMIKTRGRIVKYTDLTLKEHRKPHGGICVSKRSTKSANVMLLYILVGAGCGLVLIVIVVACFACYKRRLPARRAIPRISSRNNSAGTRKVFKARSVTKNNEPTTPAIHDLVFNELSWDGDGGFSNRALADPRALDVDYGIPIDFGTLPRLQSTTSVDSNKNSISPLTA